MKPEVVMDDHIEECECTQDNQPKSSAKDQEKYFKWSCVDSQEVPCRQIDPSRTNKPLEALSKK
ncbi:hypothetical protein Taro_030751 [Colocasia esculenta]|uniref:Uncharacterized protein n=1 Tax=Colocasia esculenta TaxID=4460 RepID=A0A843VX11_COLES|nr:hypothetical protein [Colocasia esculenta]